MAQDPTNVIDSKEKLRDRLNSANPNRKWEIFSSFLQLLSSLAEQKGNEESVVLEFSGQKFPLDETVPYLLQYLQTPDYYLKDIFPKHKPPAQQEIAETIERVIDEKAKTIGDSWESVPRRRQAQADFATTLKQRIDTLLPRLSDQGADIPIEQAIPDIINNQGSVTAASNSVSPAQIEALEEQFKKIDKARALLKKAEDIKLKDAQKSELKKREALKNRNPDTFTDEETEMFNQLEEAQKKLEDAQKSLQEKLTKYDKETLQAVEVKDAQVLISEYQPTVNFSAFLINRLLTKYTKEEIADYSGNPYPLSDAIHNLLNDIDKRAKEYLEKIEKDYKEKQETASDALNKELAGIFQLPVESTDEDTGGASTDDDSDEDGDKPDEDTKDTAESENEVLEGFTEQILALESDLYDFLPDTRSKERALSFLEDIYSSGSKRTRINADSITEFFDELSKRALDGVINLEEQAAILKAISQYVAGLRSQDEQLQEPDSQKAALPSLDNLSETEEPSSTEEKISLLKKGGRLARLNALLVAQAEAEILQRLQDAGYSEQQAQEFIASYREDLSNMVWTELLSVGGYQVLKGDGAAGDIKITSLTQVWATASNIIAKEILLREGQTEAPVQYGLQTQQEEILQLGQKTLQALQGAGFIDSNGSLTSLTKDLEIFQNPENFKRIIALTENAEVLSRIRNQLQNDLRFSETGLNQLLDDLENGNFSKYLTSDLNQLSLLAKFSARFELQHLQRLLEKAQRQGTLSEEENRKIQELSQKYFPLIQLLQIHGEEIFLLIHATKDLQDLAQFIRKTAQEEQAIAQRLPQFTQNRYFYTPSFGSYVITTTTTTVITEELEITTLLDTAKNNLALKALIAQQLAMNNNNVVAMEQQRALELMLRFPEMAKEPESLLTNTFPGGAPQKLERNSSSELAKIQKSNSGAKKLDQAQQLSKAFIAAKGNPYLMAANLLNSPEGRKMVIKAIVSMIPFSLLGIVLPWIPLVMFVKSVSDFFGGLFGGGATSTAGSLGSATGNVIVAGTQNASTSASLAGKEIAQNARAEATNAFNSAASQASSIISSTVVVETSTAILATSIAGPMILIFVFTFIVMTVIGASLNDIPMGGIKRQISQGGLGVAGCWPTNGVITGLETYPGGNPHATTKNGSAIDISAPHGEKVFAPFSGTARAGWGCRTSDDPDSESISPNYGNCLLIDTDYGFTVLLAHLGEPAQIASQSGGFIPEGQSGPIEAGQLIGIVGSTGKSTGSHLHYEVFNVPSSLTTNSYAIAEIVPPQPPLDFFAVVSTSQCGTGANVRQNACFRFTDGSKAWTEQEKAGINTVIDAINSNGSEEFQNRLCSSGSINIVRQGAKFDGQFPYSGEVVSSSTMNIYDYCFDNSQANCQFTFPHELGHIYHNRNRGIQTRMAQETTSESMVFTYPLTPGNANNEKFAEAFGVYIGQEWLGFTTNRCLPGIPNTEQGITSCESFSLRSRYPLQYNFLQENVF